MTLRSAYAVIIVCMLACTAQGQQPPPLAIVGIDVSPGTMYFMSSPSPGTAVIHLNRLLVGLEVNGGKWLRVRRADPNTFQKQLDCGAKTMADRFADAYATPYFYKTTEPIGPISHWVNSSGYQNIGFTINTRATFALYRYTPHTTTKRRRRW